MLLGEEPAMCSAACMPCFRQQLSAGRLKFTTQTMRFALAVVLRRHPLLATGSQGCCSVMTSWASGSRWAAQGPTGSQASSTHRQATTQPEVTQPVVQAGPKLCQVVPFMNVLTANLYSLTQRIIQWDGSVRPLCAVAYVCLYT